MDDRCLIECKNVMLGYDKKVVVSDLNVRVMQGDYLCIIGENGTGKSTFLKSILGLLNPISGEIVRDITVQHGRIGYLPQQTEAQKDFPATVEEIVRSGFLAAMKIRPFYKKGEKQKAILNMQRMSILPLKKCCYRELSGGQQQRVLLARALCATSDILVLDEPITGLDPGAVVDLYRILKKLNDEGVTIIMVSHDFRNAVEQAQKILHIAKDSYFYGTVKEYMESPSSDKFTGDSNHADFN